MAITPTGSSTIQPASRDPVEQALRRPVERLDRQAGSARVQLSAFGRVRSATADVEAAARAARSTDQPRTAEQTRVVARGLVNALNGASRVAGELTAAGRRNAAGGALADDARVRLAANDLRRAVGDQRNGGVEALGRIGIDVGRDGTLRIDQARFDQALRDDPNTVNQVLDRVGARVEAAAVRQNSATGNIGRAVEALSARATTLETQRDDAQARADAARTAAQASASGPGSNPFLAGGVTAYRGIFGL